MFYNQSPISHQFSIAAPPLPWKRLKIFGSGVFYGLWIINIVMKSTGLSNIIGVIVVYL